MQALELGDFVPYRRLTLRSSAAAEALANSLNDKGKIRCGPGRAYWIFKKKLGYLLLQDAGYVNPYGPFIRIQPREAAGFSIFDISLFTPGPLLLCAICIPLPAICLGTSGN
jgi:hypothetical protein